MTLVRFVVEVCNKLNRDYGLSLSMTNANAIDKLISEFDSGNSTGTTAFLLACLIQGGSKL